MKKYCVVFEYDSKKFMDVNRIIEFKKNLEKVEQAGNEIKLVFYGNGSNEEFATFMGYFNRLVQSKVCDFSISFTTKDLVIENGINNKAIKIYSTNIIGSFLNHLVHYIRKNGCKNNTSRDPKISI